MTKIEEGSKIQYKRNEDGTIVVTYDWKDNPNAKVPLKYKAGSVIETIGKDGSKSRTYYGLDPDASGDDFMVLQIHTKARGKKDVDYKNNGVHAHDYLNGKRVKYSSAFDGRDLTNNELMENDDII